MAGKGRGSTVHSLDGSVDPMHHVKLKRHVYAPCLWVKNGTMIAKLVDNTTLGAKDTQAIQRGAEQTSNSARCGTN